MITITKNEAARFLLQYHRLAPPRRFGSEADLVRFIKRVGCIQFDPLNVVAKNADLVLQSRCAGYSEGVLTRLLYESRLLLDGWDIVPRARRNGAGRLVVGADEYRTGGTGEHVPHRRVGRAPQGGNAKVLQPRGRYASPFRRRYNGP